MPNLLFELDRLRITLRNRGLPDGAVEGIVSKANAEITNAMRGQVEASMQQAVELGVDKKSSEFINELKIDDNLMQLVTESGNMSFPEPPRPMLPYLLKNAKPMKDGSGVYKIIPVGTPGKDKPKVSMSIYDSWKRLNAERVENARRQYEKVAPAASKFRTATSKQDASSKWVIPAKDNDFSEEVGAINRELERNLEQIIQDVIRSYEDSF